MENSTTVHVTYSVNEPFDPITDEARQIVQAVIFVTICGVISLFGVGANIANISVFVSQGFKDSINISLLALAVADLGCSTTMVWTSITYNPLFHSAGLPIVPLDIMYVTGGWPHVFFNRITSFITAFITLERCLCIAMPLKVKNIITPFRTKIINVSINLSMVTLFCPFYFVTKLEWVYEHSLNKSIYGIVYTNEREIVNSITFFIHSVFLSSVFLITVTVCTFILIVKLNKKTKWRNLSVVQRASKQHTASVKEKKVVKMITLISSIFIICYVPATIIFIFWVFYPEFTIDGKLQNIFFVAWSVAFILESFNSSVNIFVYFNMSSKFKVTLYQLLFGMAEVAESAK